MGECCSHCGKEKPKISAKLRLEITYDGMTLVRLYRDLTVEEAKDMGPMVVGNKHYFQVPDEDAFEFEIAHVGYDRKSGLPLVIIEWPMRYEDLADDGVGCVIRHLDLHGFDLLLYGEGEHSELPEEDLLEQLPDNMTVTCRKCGEKFVTAEGGIPTCWNCGFEARGPELVRQEGVEPSTP
jgi:hypothetical protein